MYIYYFVYTLSNCKLLKPNCYVKINLLRKTYDAGPDWIIGAFFN